MEAPQLGKLIDGPAGRDAVHVAVAPVEAGSEMWPGDQVGIGADGKAYDAMCEEIVSVGIADPFLTKQIKRGDKFWLCLYPGTVTSLRHIWTSPYFKTTPPQLPDVKNGSQE